MNKTPNKDQIVSYLYEYQMKPIHRLGQNFLIDESIAKTIVERADIQPGDKVCEIGPGFGALTGHLLEYGPLDVYELDAKMCEFLFRHYQGQTNITINHEDALKSKLGGFDIVVSNLPYYITTSLIERIYRTMPHAKRAVLMIQKDVFPRISATVGSDGYGPLSIILEYLADVKRVIEVKPDSFYPEPPVDSLVIVIEFKPGIDRGFALKLDSLLRNLFKNRRKTITNNLSMIIGSRAKTIEILSEIGISGLSRPEQIDLSGYLAMAKRLGY